MGFQPQEANGGYQGAPEKSFFVYGMPADDAILLGAEFGQHSVLIGQGGEYRLVSTREQWPEDLVKGRADKDLHVLTPGENNQINQNIAQPEGAQWPIPAFTQLDRRDVPRYPSGDKKRITLDPQFAPENRQASSWVMRNCRFAQESGILPWEYVKNYEPQAMVTYHHPSSMYGDDPGGYVVHVMGRELSGYFRTQEQAWADAAARMQGQQQQRTQSTLP
jgi:hypothetical protein